MDDSLIVLRTPSGISGDMLVTGLSRLLDYEDPQLGVLINRIGIIGLADVVRVLPWSVNQISGWRLQLALPAEHSHRSHKMISEMIERSAMSEASKTIALRAFALLAEAEARVHGIDPEQVGFHEVGALDSIIDTCLAAQLYVESGARGLYCSPLPICDGTVECAHGKLSTPAPAVQELLHGVPVYGIDSTGETVTPTALSFLKAIDAQFGNWPPMRVNKMLRAYGSRILPNVANGAIFGLGTPMPADNTYLAVLPEQAT